MVWGSPLQACGHVHFVSRSRGGMALSNSMSLSRYVTPYPSVTFLCAIVDMYERKMRTNECSISMWIYVDKVGRIFVHFYCPQMASLPQDGVRVCSSNAISTHMFQLLERTLKWKWHYLGGGLQAGFLEGLSKTIPGKLLASPSLAPYWWKPSVNKQTDGGS